MYKPDNRTSKRKVGDLGEDIACQFLEKRGFLILKRNYLRKWGELDIIAKKGDVYRFIEVKSVSGAYTGAGYRPEDNVHPQKLKRMYRAIQTYMLEEGIDSDFQIDVVTVQIDTSTRKARVEIIENIVG